MKLTVLSREIFELLHVNLQIIFSPYTLNFLFNHKRFIGFRFSDSIVQFDKEHWTFTVICEPYDKSMI